MVSKSTANNKHNNFPATINFKTRIVITGDNLCTNVIRVTKLIEKLMMTENNEFKIKEITP